MSFFFNKNTSGTNNINFKGDVRGTVQAGTPRPMCKVSYGNKGLTEEPVRTRHLVIVRIQQSEQSCSSDSFPLIGTWR